MRYLTLLLFCGIFITIADSCASAKVSTKAVEDFVRIEPRSAWNAVAPRPYKQHKSVRITVHHEGTKLLVTDDAIRKIKGIQTWGMGPEKNWADVPYHFFIAPNGTVYEARNVGTVGETNTEYDPTGHLLICCLGNLNEQPVPAAQFASLTRLIAQCSRQYTIPLDSLATHRDYSKQTTCPGKNLYALFTDGTVRKEVEAVMKKQP